MKMPNRRRALVAILTVVVACLGYCGFALNRYKNIVAQEAGTISNMKNIRRPLLDFKNANGKWPSSLEELKLDRRMLVDPMSGDLLQLNPHLQTDIDPTGMDAVLLPLVWQKAPYRSSLWPFGEMRQLVLRMSGDVTRDFNQPMR
jgi:hypothetical protein